MAELKPVPSGYDSSALSSMLGYLANARKSHDNNPFMRTILDQQARDNKQEYLADADLTVRAQQQDNDYVKQLNMAKLLQDAYDAKAGRAVDINRTSNGAITPDALTEDLNLGSQTDDSIAQVQRSMIEAQLLKPSDLKADINKKKMDTLEGGQRIGASQVELGQDDEFNIASPTLSVTPDVNNRPDVIRANIAGDALKESTKTGERSEATEPYIVVNGERQFFPREQTEAMEKKYPGKVQWAKRTLSNESSSQSNTQIPKAGKPLTVTKDVDGLAAYIAANPQLGYTGSGVDERGAYAVKDGKKIYMKED